MTPQYPLTLPFQLEFQDRQHSPLPLPYLYLLCLPRHSPKIQPIYTLEGAGNTGSWTVLSYPFTVEETEGQRGERTWSGCHSSEVVSSVQTQAIWSQSPLLRYFLCPHHMCVQTDYPNLFPLGIQGAPWDLTCEVGRGQGPRQPLNRQRPSEELLFSATSLGSKLPSKEAPPRKVSDHGIWGESVGSNHADSGWGVG